MNKIIAIVAVNSSGLIGINNKMPWNVKEDLQHFKNTTLNSTVIMGRKTWESLNKKCLSHRTNYIISKEGAFNLIEGTTAICFSNIDLAISESNLKYPSQDIFIMGGGSIYKQTLPIWDELYLTIIKEEQVQYNNGDKTYLYDYPNFLNKNFIEVQSIQTEYATYKKFTRSVFNSKIKNKLFF